MKKTMFMVVLALSMPLVSQARVAKSLRPVVKAFKANPSATNTSVDALGLTGICGAGCALKISGIASKLGSETKSVLAKMTSSSLGKTARAAAAAVLLATPAMTLADSGLTAAMLNASLQSGSWDAPAHKKLTAFAENIKESGVELAIRNTFGLTEKSEVAKKVEEIKENCKV